MKILLLSEDNSTFDDNSISRAKILEYASLADMLFVVVATDFKKKSVRTKEIVRNAWIYQTSSTFKFLHVWDVFKLASFEIRNKGVFQADVIVCEGQFASALAGYCLSKRFKRPLYISFSETNENKFFAPAGLKDFILSKIIWFILAGADCIKVDSAETKERLRKKFALRTKEIQVIKPFFDADRLLAGTRALAGKEMENDFIKRKFPELKFTAVAFVDNVKQVKLSLKILEKLNEHFPPSSLILLLSYNLRSSQANRLVKRSLRSFVRVENLGEDLCEYLVSANVFFGISEGEKYEEVLIKACAVGTTIISLESNISKKFIEDNVTGFVRSMSQELGIVDYFVAKTLLLMKNPNIGLGFKMNVAISFKQQFNETKPEYLEKLKLSWKECLAKYKKSRLKFYRY